MISRPEDLAELPLGLPSDAPARDAVTGESWQQATDPAQSTHLALVLRYYPTAFDEGPREGEDGILPRPTAAGHVRRLWERAAPPDSSMLQDDAYRHVTWALNPP